MQPNFSQMQKLRGPDLSPIQPQFLPINCQFEIDDAEDEWAFSKQFDYIHGRALVTCFWDPFFVIKQAYDVLEPGGWLEFQDGTFPFEYVDEPPAECAIRKWMDLLVEGAAKSGRPWTNVQHYKRWFEEAEFEDVGEMIFYWSMTPWAKSKYYKMLGTFGQQNILKAVEGLSLKVIKNLGWSVEEIRELIPDVKRELSGNSVHGYTKICYVYGQKPLSAR